MPNFKIPGMSVMMNSNKFKLLSLILFFLSQSVIAQEFGLQLYSLRKEFAKDVPATMAKVKEMGFKSIEMAGTYALPFPDLMKLIALNELNVVSFGVDYEKLEKFPQTLTDQARAYGAQYVVCFWIPHAGDTFTIEDVDRAAKVFNEAGKIASRNGMLFCYHPHGYEFKPYKEGTVFDYMVEKFDSRYVQFEMDVFWIKQAGQDPLALLKKYSNRFVLLHLKDRKIGTDDTGNGRSDTETNVILGTGDVGIAEIMEEAKRLGVKHYFIEDESSLAEEQIPKSVAYLKSLTQ